MLNLIKTLFRLHLSEEDKRVLKILKDSTVTSKRVIGRGALTLKTSEVTTSAKFKQYKQKASEIVSSEV